MTYAAVIKHRIPGRLRLRLVEEDPTPDDVEQVLARFKADGRISRIEANLLTRSLLLEAQSDGDLQDVLDAAKKDGFFDFSTKEGRAEKKDVTTLLEEFRTKLDRLFRDWSDDRLNLESGMALILGAIGLRQIFFGKFLPAGLTLIFYAFGMLELNKLEKS